MTQYIDKAAVVTEIKKIEYETNYEPFTDEVLGKRKVCKDIKDSLDTLEVKEVDLDKEIERFVKSKEFQKASGTIKVTNLLAKHFFELGLKVQKGE